MAIDRLDSKTEQELMRIENHLTIALTKQITEGFKEIKESITELFNKDIEYMKETQGRFAHHHNEHFQNNKERIKDISKVETSIDSKIHIVVDDKIELLGNKIEQLEKSQIACKARREESEDIEDKTDRKRNTNIAFVGAIVAVLAFLTGFLL